jgi:antitoxin YefM
MINAIKQKVIVEQGGKIEILSPELPEGAEVEVIVILESETAEKVPQDTTEYLLSTEANRKHLLEAIENLEKRENLVVITPEEWNEKYNV